MIESGRTGLLVPPKDAAALADAIVRLLTDHPLADMIARAGHDFVQANFSVEHMVRAGIVDLRGGRRSGRGTFGSNPNRRLSVIRSMRIAGALLTARRARPRAHAASEPIRDDPSDRRHSSSGRKPSTSTPATTPCSLPVGLYAHWRRGRICQRLDRSRRLLDHLAKGLQGTLDRRPMQSFLTASASPSRRKTTSSTTSAGRATPGPRARSEAATTGKRRRLHNACISSTIRVVPSITIRDVPQETRDILAARAARAGQSLQEHLKGELINLAEKPTVAEVLQRARARARTTQSYVAVEEILSDLDAERS